jgi:hypothetical protein
VTRAAASGLVVALALLFVSAATASPPLRASASLAPRHISFGDVVEARVVVDLGPGRVDPASVVVSATFAPFTASGPPSVTRRTSNGLAAVMYRYVLICLTDGCVPTRAGTVFAPATATALVDGRRHTVVVRWPRLVVTPRSSERDAARSTAPFRSNTSLPPVAEAIPATLLIALLALAAAVLALAAVAGLRAAFRRPRPRLPSLPPLERAIALVRETAREADEARRRKALESLADSLQACGEEALGGETRALAWSADPPTREPMDHLAERAAREVAR